MSPTTGFVGALSAEAPESAKKPSSSGESSTRYRPTAEMSTSAPRGRLKHPEFFGQQEDVEWELAHDLQGALDLAVAR